MVWRPKRLATEVESKFKCLRIRVAKKLIHNSRLKACSQGVGLSVKVLDAWLSQRAQSSEVHRRSVCARRMRQGENFIIFHLGFQLFS